MPKLEKQRKTKTINRINDSTIFDSGYSSLASMKSPNPDDACTAKMIHGSEEVDELKYQLLESLKSGERYCQSKLKEFKLYSAHIDEFSYVIGSLFSDQISVDALKNSREEIKGNVEKLWNINADFSLLYNHLDFLFMDSSRYSKRLSLDSLLPGKNIFHNSDDRMKLSINAGNLSLAALRQSFNQLIEDEEIQSFQQLKYISVKLIKITQQRLNMSRDWTLDALGNIIKMEHLVF